MSSSDSPWQLSQGATLRALRRARSASPGRAWWPRGGQPGGGGWARAPVRVGDALAAGPEGRAPRARGRHQALDDRARKSPVTPGSSKGWDLPVVGPAPQGGGGDAEQAAGLPEAEPGRAVALQPLNYYEICLNLSVSEPG